MQVFGPLGMQEFDALLDTGASFTSIPVEEAANLGYSLIGAPTVSITAAAGQIAAPLIELERVKVGPYEEVRVPAVCLTIPGGAISAIAGLSLLARFRVDLDFPGGVARILKPTAGV